MVDTNTRVLIANSNDESKQEWLILPFEEEEFDEVLERIGVDDANSVYDSLMSGENNGDTVSTYEIMEWESDIVKKECCEDIFEANSLVESIEDMESYEYDMLNAIMNDGGYSLSDAIEKIEAEEVDYYPNMSLTEVAEQFVDDGIYDSDTLLKYIDYEKLADSLSDEGYFETDDGVLRID